MEKTKKNILRWLLIILGLGLAALILGGIRWATYARPPLPEAIAAVKSDQEVQIIHEPWLTFSPADISPSTGLIFYPGGRIDPRGYAVLLREIATAGTLVIVPEMPINMAALNPGIATEITAEYPEIHQWVIGGHSVGGAMAAQYTANHPDAVDGLVIWASYPPRTSDLSGHKIPVVSIYGSREQRVNDTSIQERKSLLPEDTRYIRIEGGDHHQFGSYRINPEENLATISRESQQIQIIAATLPVLEAVSEGHEY